MADEKDDFKKHRYQYKAFFWSLGNKTTVQSKKNLINRHNADVYHRKSEN
ncbi:hypothetical protein [Croceitalea rosinachiae]|uniref:Uncharacterized protein n=1 Tax=Croceitalea rosinachiae TaxID=3075596 RepID=A0ABU3A823_9FLAO|nr:hypothetical protein [Croceitalea sp. F388]MDT0606030.1 hypothetical protein [Croceitalea sp. F388]